MDISAKNADRFLGFADIYENTRPEMPKQTIEIIKKYAGKKPDFVVDLGCGTGLSTMIWRNNCNSIMGIEPSDDMLSIANKKADCTVSFKKAYAHETGLKADSADAVICSQSFHWMNPDLTLAEINRILKIGGVFATIDCDWPPVCNWQAEKAYEALFEKINIIEENHPDMKNSFSRWDKNKHLNNIGSSGFFRYCREIVFSDKEDCNAERFIAIALSQGGLQSILKKEPTLITEDVESFTTHIYDLFGDKNFEIDFCYRMRIGVK